MSKPFVIDLDGTLIHTDLLYQSLFTYIKQHPLNIISPIIWLSMGKANLKTELARRIAIDVSVLPYDPAIIELIKNEKAKNRQIILATASHKIYADQIASHLNLFGRVLATDESLNFSSHAKRDYLVAEFGEGGFDYAGNSHADIAVWEAASKAYLINPEKGVEKRAAKKGNVERIIKRPSQPIALWLKALRPHQWMKNLLIFVPLLAAHKLGNSTVLLNGLLAFVCFAFCASSGYVLNDLMDIEDDRHHKTKRKRPFASGALSIKAGILAVPLLLITSITISLLSLPWKFTMVLCIYFLATLAYSIVLKRVTAVDIIILSLLYTIRILAGVLPARWFLRSGCWLSPCSSFLALPL